MGRLAAAGTTLMNRPKAEPARTALAKTMLPLPEKVSLLAAARTGAAKLTPPLPENTGTEETGNSEMENEAGTDHPRLNEGVVHEQERVLDVAFMGISAAAHRHGLKLDVGLRGELRA